MSKALWTWLWVAVSVAETQTSFATAAPPLEFDLLEDEKYAEQVVAIADLSDGIFAKVLLGVSNVGPGDQKGGCQFLVVDPKGDAWHASRVVEREEWNYESDRQQLRIGRCTATAGKSLIMHAVLDEGSVKITLQHPPERRTAGRVELGSDFWEVDTLVRWADCIVEIERNGERRTLSGRAYADHPRSKIFPSALADRWFRFRALQSDDPRLVLIRWPKHKPPEGWHESSQGRTDLHQAILRRLETGGWKARFRGKTGEWRVTTTTLLHRDAPIEAQGKLLGALLNAVVGNPVTYTFRAILEERGTKARISGIAEITLTDE